MRSYRITAWYNAQVAIRPSAIQGSGMYATAPLAVGEVVSVAGGTVMSEAAFQAYCATVTRWNAMQIGEGLHLVELVQTPDGSQGSINHSCNSNLWMLDEVTLVARHDIAAGEELTLDYALTTVEPEWVLNQPCQCGSVLCRHRITGNDWLLPDVQQRYQGHFAPFINARIQALRPQ